MIGSCSVCDKALMRQLHSNPIAVSGSDDTAKKINSFDVVIYMQQAVFSRMQPTLIRLAEYLTVLRASC